MQLILEADNIDIERNMSTIEQEPLNEKFLANKVIDHIADDITMGNKENIQKQENIILDAEDNNVTDTEKEITTSDDETLTNNLIKEKLNEGVPESGDIEIPEEIIEDKNIKRYSELLLDDLITKNANIEESLPKENEEKSDELNSTSESESKENDIVVLDKNSSVEEILTENNSVSEISTKENEENDELDKEVDISELSTELNEEKEMDLDKEVDISELSTELNEEKEMDLDKEVDISKVSTELHIDNDIREDSIVNTVTSKDEIEKESVSIEVPSVSLDGKAEEPECSEIENTKISETNEKSIPIEIDDEDEKTNEEISQSDQTVQELTDNMDTADESQSINQKDTSSQQDTTTKNTSKDPDPPKRICRLSNNLDIFSDEEDDPPNQEPPKEVIQPSTDKQCINIDDDDDIMLIDEDTGTKDKKNSSSVEANTESVTSNTQSEPENNDQTITEVNINTENKQLTETVEEPSPPKTENKDKIESTNDTSDTPAIETKKMAVDKPEESDTVKKPLLPKNFINTCKKNLADMTRNDLEEFCILKIVESIVDRSNLGEIKTHLKNLTQTMEECKKKCFLLTKQNKDLQIVLKSVQEEQKSASDVHITPLKITRSVGMQVVMVAEKNVRKKPVNGVGTQSPTPNNNNKQVKNQQTHNTRNVKEKTPLNQIPVPRLVPATPPAIKANQTPTNTTITKQVTNISLPNGMRISPPVQKTPEKRPRSQAVTVDLTDDEPPPKLQNVQRGPVNQPMRVLTAAPNLIPTQRLAQNINSPRKVYIPISGPQAQNVRPGQTIMLKPLTGLGPRPRAQAQALMAKTPIAPNPVRFARGQPSRHPAPLPDAMKQYQPPNWKSLPPAPDLKLSKVENGIVISWKIDGYQEDNHEEIASYQLYAYQETSSPPNTALWKKIGDVKALPLPMACTLTQFMAGYKYYFAVRAVDIRSRFGPFSLPGSILLLNKM